MTGRIPLNDNQKILLCEGNNVSLRKEFTINRLLSDQGASVMCYEASYETSGRGILKEFYPREAYGMERDDDGQLVRLPDFEDAYNRFMRAQKEYTEPYEILLDIKRRGENEDIATFIPPFEIYHGCDGTGKIIGTTYIWTPEPKLETFDKVCDGIHEHPSEMPEHKLVTVLTAIETLTKCICVLHSAGLVHRDIKPSNFGFMKRRNETLTQALSMFDIDSICSVYAKNQYVIGTDGYLAPEAEYGVISNRIDIYSIGATLFTAIVITDETEEGGYLYEEEYYDRLREMVDDSKLIQASESNAHPRLRYILTRILRKCLCGSAQRYASCEELTEDLQEALYYALPAVYAQQTVFGDQWVLKEAEKFLDKNKDKNSFLAIQYHLYKYPLYQCGIPEEEDLNVLVIGFGNYGQKFLDACLQNGQMRDKKLRVTVISDDDTDRDIYLSDRTELGAFFNIDGALAGSEDTYGDIDFLTREWKEGDPDTAADILGQLLSKRYHGGHLHYVFIALGEDRRNLAAAKVCRKVLDDAKQLCTISFACEDRRIAEGGTQFFCPLYINNDIRQSPLNPEIERMAFNTHLAWEDNLNINYREIKKKFRKRYNHDSSVSCVLSIKYKLHSAGIDLDVLGPDEAAARFNRLISDKKNRRIRDELIWVEHRRWVTEKLCLGWKKFRDLEECAGGMTKDERGKRHVCMVKSRPGQGLLSFRQNGHYDRWDTASDDELAELDELDRMSVQLHRVYAKKAAELSKKQNLLSGNSIAGIRHLIAGDRKAMAAFQEWYTCLKDIWHGETEKARMYQSLKSSFLKSADSLSEEQKGALHRQVEALETVFKPVLESTRHRDYKQNDAVLVDNIPFILTYTEDTCLVIPYATGDNTAVFGNVAAATVVNPAKILYLYLVEREQDIEKLRKTIPYVTEYMQKKECRATVDFIVIRAADTFDDSDFQKEIRSPDGKRIGRVQHIMLNRSGDALKELEKILKEQSAKKAFFAIEKNTTGLSYMMQGAGLYNLFAGYRFDSDQMKFYERTDCEMLSYIRKRPFITVADMAAFRLSSSESSSCPEFYADYGKLWKKYSENSGYWKKLCALLKEHSEKQDTLIVLKKKGQKDRKEAEQVYSYILPFACGRGAQKIIAYLKKQGILEPESRVSGYTTDSCEAVLYDRYGLRARYDRLFSEIYALLLPDSLSLHLNTRSHEVKVKFDSLKVTDVQLPADRGAELGALLNFFKERKYLINLVIDSDGRASFTYATPQIKQLLTTEGRILEIYTYHKAKELGSFDDVVNSFEIQWENTDVRSEFDCILTKGFRSLFVECKARPDLQQEFYYKLAGLAEQFGINATAVLIADTREKSYYDTALVNAMQRRRGRMMHVVTIWKPEEIANIGHTLLKIINGTYTGEE